MNIPLLLNIASRMECGVRALGTNDGRRSAWLSIHHSALAEAIKFVDDNFDDVRLNVSEASSFYYEIEPHFYAPRFSIDIHFAFDETTSQ